MPLSIHKRGKIWHVRGRVEYRGRPITGYYRKSTESSEEAGAWEWCREEEKRVLSIRLLGENPQRIIATFADAVLKYPAKPKEAGYLLPITNALGAIPISRISPKLIRDLAPKLYPNAGTETWTRQVVTPARAVMNHYYDSDDGTAFRVRGYSKAESIAQDIRRGSSGRKNYPPGSWEWVLLFRQHAPPRLAALALLMFVTGSRISQAIDMHPHIHLDRDQEKVKIPGAKGHDDRWLPIQREVFAELAALPPKHPRTWARKDENLRLFGYADRGGPRKAWERACRDAGIEMLPFHSAGRHGYGQEMNVREGVDEKAAAEFGGWSDFALMRRTYTHAEDTAEKIGRAFQSGLSKAEQATGLRLKRS
jgi:integrase